MKKYINPTIDINKINTGDIMNGSNEPSFLNTQTRGSGGSLDFGSDLGLNLN